MEGVGGLLAKRRRDRVGAGAGAMNPFIANFVACLNTMSTVVVG